MTAMIGAASSTELALESAPGSIRVATFNADMARKGAGVLIEDIARRDPQVLNVAEIILRVRPDILLLNEIDHDPGGLALRGFVDLLAQGVSGLEGLDYRHHFTAPVNTGVPSGLDLDQDGRIAGPRDAWGFGRFPGQYGMAVLSRLPLGQARTFRELRWAEAPWADQPRNPDNAPFYPPEIWSALRLSSKSHWDISASLPEGAVLHLLASHPTPPVFDGPEDRNGLRNAAEIRFWIDYLDEAPWIIDDQGQKGGLPSDGAFVLLGDLNTDPAKGAGDNANMQALLAHDRVQDIEPSSPGALAAGRATDTADWPKIDGPGNLRVDYVLPASGLNVTGSGVFWPDRGDPLARLVAISGRNRASSDHRLVWVDIAPPSP